MGHATMADSVALNQVRGRRHLMVRRRSSAVSNHFARPSSFETRPSGRSSERENVSLSPANFTVLVWRTPSAQFSAESATEWRRASPIPQIAEAGLPRCLAEATRRRVPLICPDVSNVFASSFNACQRPPATLHGVVFHISVGSANRLDLAAQVVANGKSGQPGRFEEDGEGSAAVGKGGSLTASW